MYFFFCCFYRCEFFLCIGIKGVGIYIGIIYLLKFLCVIDRDIVIFFGKNKVIYMLINLSVCVVNVDCSICVS